MKAGDLREVVTVLQREVTRDAMGGEITTWVEFAREYASVVDLNGREYFAAQQAQAEITTQVRMRYVAGVSALMRVEREGGDVLEVVSVVDVNGRQVELKLLCRRFVKE